eukprot:TRINITY_DN9388_c0_g3_i2.p1 TRINITY_DN9388_c0_g3~~TRINITY_DN9388_c0_g3_i2.p1  ORF type:complete len:369 (-),score=158.07 TRINITY_DN9388_c0_g3_i2:68-1174(-)
MLSELELEASVQPDTEKYFFETNRLEVNPNILLMEQKLVDTDRQIKLLTKKLADEEAKMAALPMHNRSQHKREEEEIINYTSAVLMKEEERLADIVEKEQALKKEKQACLEKASAAKREIENYQVRLQDLGDEDAKVVAEKITEEEQKKSDFEREFKQKHGEIDMLKKKREKHEKLKASYSKFLTNMTDFASSDSLSSKKSELEQLMDLLDKHYGKIKATSILELRKKHGTDTTMKELIFKSNEELSQLETIPAELKFEKSDLRYDVFMKIWEIMQDNIAIRKELNTYTEVLNEHLTEKLVYSNFPNNVMTYPIEALKTLKPSELGKVLADTQVLLEIDQSHEPAEGLIDNLNSSSNSKSGVSETPES